MCECEGREIALLSSRAMRDLLLRACRGEPVPRPPVWLMRQAGRYLPEYRRIRERTTFLELCKTPELAAEVTVQPVDILGVDAAIVFADILLVLEAMGAELRFEAGDGPRFPSPVRSVEDAARLRRPDVERDARLRLLHHPTGAARARRPGAGHRFRRQPLDARRPTWSRVARRTSFPHLLAWSYADPAGLRRLLDRIADATIDYLRGQVEAGAEALQIFDTWGGLLERAALGRDRASVARAHPRRPAGGRAAHPLLPRRLAPARIARHAAGRGAVGRLAGLAAPRRAVAAAAARRCRATSIRARCSGRWSRSVARRRACSPTAPADRTSSTSVTASCSRRRSRTPAPSSPSRRAARAESPPASRTAASICACHLSALKSEVSTTRYESSSRSGESERSLSRRSRSPMAATTSSSPALGRARCSSRRRRRRAPRRRASRKNLCGVSGKTTEPMSRPSTTAPDGRHRGALHRGQPPCARRAAPRCATRCA